MKIGFSEIIITPDIENRRRPLQLAGYSPRELCTGVHDDIYARAAYFEGDEKQINSHVLMIICDLIYINRNFADIIKNHISKIIPIIPENIMISATHTHHGPDYDGVFRPGGSVELFKGFLFPKPQIEELVLLGKKLNVVAKDAYAKRKKALIGSIQTEIPEKDRVMINRRDLFNFEKAKYPITVIKVISNEQEDKDHLFGIILNYACHGTVLPRQNTLITADYVGYVIKAIEEEYPDLKGNTLYFNGPCGEINPLSSELRNKMKIKGPSRLKARDIYQQVGTWDDAKRIGFTIAKYSLKVLDKIKCNEYNDLKVICRNIRIPIRDYPYGSDLKSALNRSFYKIKYRLISKLIKLNILKSNILFNIDKENIKKFVESIVQIINLGDLVIVTAPGEFFLELGNEVINYAKSIFPTKNALMIELANDSIGYLYTIEAYRKGGYESALSIIPLGGRFVTMKLKHLINELQLNN